MGGREELSMQKGQRVSSSKDERIVNNVMRHEYRVLSESEKIQIQAIKDLGEEFLHRLDSLGNSRELALARTKMEEAVMWSVKHITA
jgi:hypothetical protein